jgi:hypothetical protein
MAAPLEHPLATPSQSLAALALSEPPPQLAAEAAP